MVTLVKTLDVGHIVRTSKRMGIKFNALMCWCIGTAAQGIKEFYILPEHGKLFQYDKLAINVIVNNSKGGINSCDIPYSDDLQQFANDYQELTAASTNECKSSFLEECMVIGTSANQYTDQFSNPMVMWGKYRKGLLQTTLSVSFQFHHVQMDGGQAATFLDELQKAIKTLRPVSR